MSVEAKAEAGQTGEPAATEPAKNWCERIFDELELLAPKDEVSSYYDVEKQPQWVIRVLLELSQQVSPAVRLRSLKIITPRGLGLHLGQQCANLYALGERMKVLVKNDINPEQVEKKAENLAKVLEANKDKPTVRSVSMLMSQLGEGICLMENSIPKFESILHRAFKEALDQDNYGEAVQFYSGFATGLSKKGFNKSGPAREKTTALIYQKMFTHWFEIEKLGSVPELRMFLIRHGVTVGMIGQPKRLEKICERIGLTLRKPGRPAKSENYDAPPA